MLRQKLENVITFGFKVKLQARLIERDSTGPVNAASGRGAKRKKS
jgi:hypothetical protein